MTWNPGNPTAANQIVNDLPDIVENFAHLAFWQMKRAKFTYNGGDTAYTVKAGAACYYVKDKVAYWVSELTTGAVGTPAASTRYYLYLDYSEITSGTLIVTGKLIWSSTAPTYSHTLGGWYNGDDLCIFGVITNAGPTNINEFFHDGGDYVQWADSVQEYSGGPGTTWTDVDMATSMPAFSTRTRIYTQFTYIDSDTSTGYVRVNGQTGTTGIVFGYVTAAATRACNGLEMLTDATQIIEVKLSTVGNNQVIVRNNGFYFPAGM